MEKIEKELKRNIDFTLQKIATDVVPLSDEKFGLTSLGPFLRITQSKKNVLYLLVYFNTKIEEADIKVTEITNDRLPNENEEVLDEIKIDITHIENPPKLQNLWAILIKPPGINLKEKAVICNVDFNEKPSEPTISYGDPKRGTKVIIVK